jgi:virulence factor
MRIGIIGLGNICEKAYLPYITSKENIELIFCTRNEKKLGLLKNKYKIKESASTVEELIKMNIEGAFVHTTTESHVEIIEKLLRNNINVYVDKPISYSYEESKRMVALAKEKGVTLMVGFNRRFAPMYSIIRDYEKPTIIKVEKNRLYSPKQAEVVVLDDFIHILDTARFLIGDKVEIYNVKALKQENLVYNLVVTLGNEHTTGVIIMNRDSGGNEEVLEYISPGNKVIVKDLVNSTYLNNNKIEKVKFNDWDSTLYKRGFEPIVDEFIESIELGRDTKINIDDALETHRLCEQIISEINLN